MKKITFLALHLSYGGIEKCISDVANLLSSDFDIEILSTYKITEPVYKLNNNIKITYLTNVKPNKQEFVNCLKHFRLIKAFIEGIKSIKVLRLKKSSMINALKNNDSDIIISSRDYFNKLLGKYSKCKLKIAWEHNHHHQRKAYIKNLIKSCKNIDKLVLVSEELNSFYTSLFKEKNMNCKCVCIPNFISEIPKKRTKLDNNNLISVGRLSPEKGYLDLIDVYKLIDIENGSTHLDIIGDGKEYKKINKKIIKNNLSRKITMHGFKDMTYINNMYLNSSIYLMTSFTESFGLVLLEAMSHGVVPISYDSAEGARNIIVNDYNGYLIKNRNEHDMSKIVLDLLNNKEKLKELSDNAYKSVNKYNKENAYKNWIKLLKEDK